MIKYDALLEPGLGVVIDADAFIIPPEKCRVLLMEQLPDTNSVTFEIKVENINQLFTLKLIHDNRVYLFKNVKIDEISKVVTYKDPIEVHVSYFTFGCGQTYNGHYIEIICDVESDPRDIMNSGHGNKWSMEYMPREWYEVDADGSRMADKWCWSRLLTLIRLKEVHNGYDGIVVYK